MSVLNVCPQGHSWEPSGETAALCPVCGSAGQPQPASGETVDFGPESAHLDATLDAAPTQPAAPGTPTVPGYEILGELGRGGMGVVWKARHLGLNRLVALKMILAGGHAGPDERQRFRTEAEAVAQLAHPHIVQIHDVGECDGLLFCSLEFCPGGSLSDQLDGTPWPGAKAAALVETLARAMNAAHERGIVHRDLKPANVLLAEDGSPRITDFGLAKKLEEDSGQTRSGAILGTPSYMAPEQAQGKVHEIAPAADTYALGAILYELLTGRPPFRAATPLETVLQVLADEPVPPARLNPAVPVDLQTICLKCLQKEPGRRYGSAQELAEDLRRFQAGEPIRARPLGSLRRAIKWVRRRPLVAGLLAALVILGAVSFVVVLLLWLHAAEQAEQRRIALVGEASAREHADRETARALAALSEEEIARGKAQAAEQRTAAALVEAHVSLYASQLARIETERLGSPHRANALLDLCAFDVRGWEWPYLKGFLEPSHLTLNLMGQPSTLPASFAWRPDGREVALTVELNKAVILDAVTSRPRVALQPMDGIRGLTWSPDGRLLASCSDSPRVRLWDPATGKEVRTFDTPIPQLACLAFSPDGRLLACGGGSQIYRPADQSYEGCDIVLWDLSAGRIVRVLTGHKGIVNSLAFHRDGRLLASGSDDQTARLWDVTDGRFQKLDNKQRLWAVAFSPDGQILACGGDSTTPRGKSLVAHGQLVFWNVQRGFPKSPPLTFPWGIHGLAYSPSGDRLAVGAAGADPAPGGSTIGLVQILDGWSGRVLQTLPGDGVAITGVSYGPDGRRLATVSSNGRARIHELTGGPEHLVLNEPTNPFHRVCFSPDSRQVACAGHSLIVIRDRITGERRLALPVTSFIFAIVWSPDGVHLATCEQAGPVRLWDARTGEPLRTWDVPAVCLAFRPDGKVLAAGLGNPPLAGSTTTLRLLEVASGRELPAPLTEDAALQWIRFHPDGRRLMGGNFRKAFIWDLADNTRLQILEGAGLAHWSPDGKTLVTSRASGALSRYDDTGRVLLGTATTIRMNSFRFTPDGRRLLLSVTGRGAVVVDPITGQELCTVRDDPKATSYAFSPDGRCLAVVSEGEVLLTEVLAVPNFRPVTASPGSGGTSLALGPACRRLVIGHSRTGIEVRDTEQGGTAAQLRDPTTGNPVLFLGPLTLCQDGRMLALNRGPLKDGEAQPGATPVIDLWDLDTQKRVGSLTGHSRVASDLIFSPDGSLLAAIPDNGEVVVWNASENRLLWTLQAHEEHASGVAFQPGGRLLATSGVDRLVRLWDLETGKEVRRFEAPVGLRIALAFSPDGRRLASAGSRIVKTWDPATGQELGSIALQDVPESLQFSPDSQQLLVVGGTRVELYELRTGKCLESRVVRSQLGTRAAFSPDGRHVAVASGWVVNVCETPLHTADRDAWQHQVWELRRRHGLRQQVEDRITREQWATALFPADALLETAPNDLDILAQRGRVLVGLERWPEALATFTRRTELRPDSPDVWLDRALLHAQSGQHEAARADLNRAVALALDDPAIRLARYGILRLLGLEDAAADLDQACRVSPELSLNADRGWQDRFPVGGSRMAVEIKQERCRKVEAMLSGRMRAPTVARWTGLLAATPGLPAPMVVATVGAARLAPLPVPQLTVLLQVRGLLRTVQARWTDARSDLQAVVDLEPGDVAGWRALARVHAEMSSWAQAVSACTEALNRDATAWEMYYLRGIARARVDFRHSMVLPDHGEAIRRGGDGLRVRMDRAAHAGLQGQWDEVIADCTAALEKHPDSPEALGRRGAARAERGQWLEAAADLLRLPEKKGSLESAIVYQLRGGDREGYRKSCRALWDRLQPTSVPAEIDAALWLAVLGPDSGVPPTDLVRRSEQMGGVALGAILRHGAAHYRAGNYDKALAYLQQSAGSRGVEAIEERLFLAMTEHQRGQKEKAKGWLAEAVRFLERPRPPAKPGAPLDRIWIEREVLRAEAEALLAGKKP
jgi:WD40 repeat protein/tetratricopeptide (TPR) repeat protein